MAEKLISLYKRKMEKLTGMVNDNIEQSNAEFSHIDDELIDFMIQKGEITLNDAVKTIWLLIESMDKLEQEILQLKLTILEATEIDKE